VKILDIRSGGARGLRPGTSPAEIECDLISWLSLDLDGSFLETEVKVIGWLQELSLFLMARLPDFAWYRRSLVSGGVFEAKQLPGCEAEIMFHDLDAGRRVPVRLEEEEIHNLVRALVAAVEETSVPIAESLRRETAEGLEEWRLRRRS
jgi:hypothetical protein